MTPMASCSAPGVPSAVVPAAAGAGLAAWPISARLRFGVAPPGPGGLAPAADQGVHDVPVAPVVFPDGGLVRAAGPHRGEGGALLGCGHDAGCCGRLLVRDLPGCGLVPGACSGR